MVNEWQVVDALERYGFEVVFPDRITVAQEIDLFCDAEIVAGPVGAAFSSERSAMRSVAAEYHVMLPA